MGGTDKDTDLMAALEESVRAAKEARARYRAHMPDDSDPVACTCETPVPADTSRATGTPVGDGGALRGECATCRRLIVS